MHWYVSGERRIIAVDGDSADAQEGRPNRVDVFCATASQAVEEFLQQRNFLSKTPLKVMPPLYQTTQFQATPRLNQTTQFKSKPSLYQTIQLQITPPLYQTIQLKATPPLYQTTPFQATPPLYQTITQNHAFSLSKYTITGHSLVVSESDQGCYFTHQTPTHPPIHPKYHLSN